jgi:hypothetical protein
MLRSTTENERQEEQPVKQLNSNSSNNNSLLHQHPHLNQQVNKVQEPKTMDGTMTTSTT